MATLDPQYADAIKGFEGYSPNASWDYKQYSSGYGTKAQPGDENIPPDQRQAVYDQRFQDETGKAANSVDSFAPNLPPGVRAALTSLTYNAGPGWQQSGLGDAVKAGDWDKAQQIFLQYNHAGGQVNPGLTARRQKEAAWFGGGLPPTQQTAQASPASQPGAPLQITPQTAPQQQATIFPQAIPQQAAPDAPTFAPQAPQLTPQSFPPVQMAAQSLQAPIFYAPRRSPDLSGLRAAFSQPIFSKG